MKKELIKLIRRIIGEKEKIDLIKQQTNKRIARFSRNKKKTLPKLNRIIRLYLKEKYNIKESLTIEEIKNIFKEKNTRKAKKRKILELLTQIRDIEYSPNLIVNDDQILEFIKKFKEIIVI